MAFKLWDSCSLKQSFSGWDLIGGSICASWGLLNADSQVPLQTTKSVELLNKFSWWFFYMLLYYSETFVCSHVHTPEHTPCWPLFTVTKRRPKI